MYHNGWTVAAAAAAADPALYLADLGLCPADPGTCPADPGTADPVMHFP